MVFSLPRKVDTYEISRNKYIIHVGISVETGNEVFYTVFDIKKT